MLARGKGSIVNMSSVMGRKAFARFGSYAIVMHGVSAFSDALRQEVADDGRALPLDRCFILRDGYDVSIVTWGAMTLESLRAAAELDAQGVSAEVIDLATLSPIDGETILDSVAKTGRLVIVHEAARNVGVGAEIAAIVAEQGLYDLLAPIQRVTGFDTIMPLFRLEHDYIPGVQRIVDAVRLTLAD